MKPLFPLVSAATLATTLLPSIAFGQTVQTTPAPRATTTPAAVKAPAPKRDGVSGVWEVQLQSPTATTYTHFKLVQAADVLTGQYLDANGKRYPLAGTMQGKDVRLVVSMPDGSSLVFDGSVEANSDMAGTMESGKDVVGFTAAYRPKYKWIDSVNPQPGGVGTP